MQMSARHGLLKDQSAVVTGGSRGIGRAIVEKFVSEGARVAILGRNRDAGNQAVEEIKNLYPGSIVQFYSVDVAKTEQVNQVLLSILEDFKVIDILVNNAGIADDQLLLRMTEASWDAVLETNLKSCYNTCKFVVKSMIKNRYGRIINISSVVGLIGNPGQVSYAASKAGMIGFTKSLAKEVASRGVLVNCIAPGFIQTEMTGKLSDSQRDLVLNSIPLKTFGRGEDIAFTALFLASKMSNYMTGQVLTVDGGMVM